MQCASCQFENMPGSELCGRCGTSLQLAAAAVEVHPPRAASWRKRARRYLPFGRIRSSVAEGYHRLSLERTRRWDFDAHSAAIVPRLIVPGWAHLRLGLGGRGRWLLYPWLALLAGAAVMWGTFTGSLLVGLAFGLHTLAVSDMLTRGPSPWTSRGSLIIQAMGRALLLAVLIYLPAGWLVTRFAWPSVVENQYGPLQSGDVVLVNQWAYLRSAPRAGEVVLYQMPTATALRGYVYYRFGGQRIDRIVATAGDRVHWQAGRLWINGVESSLLPLNPIALPATFQTTVPEGSLLILPTADLGPQTSPEIWETLSIVPQDQVHGRAYWRHHPLSRLGMLR